MNKYYGQDWETLIKDRMRPAATICKEQDPVKRAQKEAVKRWRQRNAERYQQKKKEWCEKNPEKMKIYAERRKPAIQKWQEENHDRVVELRQKTDAQRANDPKRIAWRKEYLQRPEVKARRAELDRARNKTPERREYMRLRGIQKREKARLAKLQEA